ncbi:AI-2E family transporter [Paenibacillus sp. GCM10012307]|uniref:AI-2E family transporter n=1 Tax=Paenibacillus roseus TaxID=2798579 RepID=A0A934MS68_9BACL|nr:AI-2E family transporter [Paenibacillus roseus]
MDKFMKHKAFAILVYAILGLLVLYLLMQVRPIFTHIYVFLKAVLAPFLIAMIISYVLNPVVSLLADRRVPRSIAVLLIYAVFCGAFAVVLMNIIPMLLEQMETLNRHAPELSMRAQSLIDNMNNNSFLPDGVRSGLTRSVTEMERRVSEIVTSFVNNIGEMLNVVFVAFIIPFLAFYILKDFDVFERTVITYVPRKHRKNTVKLFKDIDAALGSYIRGQFLVCFIVGLLAYVGYWLIGLPYALLLAVLVAVFNIIPYLGPFFGAAPALVVASTISPKMMLLVIIVNTVCQILEGNVVSPQVVGRTLHMHPLSIIFVLLVGGQVAGIIGMILAVPIYAALKVVLQHIFAYYIRKKTI